MEIGNQQASRIKLANNVEDLVLNLVLIHFCNEGPTNSEMKSGAQFFGGERIRSLLDAVVEKLVGAILAKDEPGMNGFPEGRVHRFFRFPVNQGQSGDLGDVA